MIANESNDGSYWVETDNALGSSHGDIDDGFALAITRLLPVSQYLCTYGNTPSDSSFQNTKNLMLRLGTEVPIQKSCARPEAKLSIPPPLKKTNYLALGPLTTLANIVKTDSGRPQFNKIILVGGRPSHTGNLYPYWPHEFNFCKDPKATLKVFQSNEDLRMVPLNQASRLKFFLEDWRDLPTSPYDFKKPSLRWLLRNLLLKGKLQITLWDAVAVASQVWPSYFAWKNETVFVNSNGRVSFQPFKGSGHNVEKVIGILQDFDLEKIKKKVKETITS